MFAEAGMDSLAAVEARDTLSSRLQLSLPPTILFDYASPRALATALMDLVPSARADAAEGVEPETVMTGALTVSRPASGVGAALAATSSVMLISSASMYPHGAFSTASKGVSLV